MIKTKSRRTIWHHGHLAILQCPLFPYIAGLRPYSRREEYNRSDPVIKSALDWFQIQVPERTQYNWQAEGAQLMDQDLREKNEE